ncbi:squamosa promoter-binding 8 [Olea europaea subsp. europaea]|uniref:Squamosa promoter-binding 8 n=1 Tax=Olea europaea subsp. europaea TaxID=158383 RepID=A0A8S0PJT1_OLEEU|nr:squamosa promoter-binding 8 [Olea europaea subsp. europaea]
MLEYEWANPLSTIMLSSEGTVQESNQNRQIFYPYSATLTAAETATFFNPNPHFTTTATSQHQHPFHHTETLNSNTQLTNLYDPRVYCSASASSYPAEASMLGLEPDAPSGFTLMPKSEPVVGRVDFNSSASRIGLNLGGRTYFASSEGDSVNRLYRPFREVDPGLVNSPRCQAEGCSANLAHAKHYHRRHKVCEFHSKASTVITAGLTQRFCQQCSRFHMLSEFDNGKRSCRKRLADHNRRRRKSQLSNQKLISKVSA